MFEQVSTTLEGAIDKLDIPVDSAALTRCYEMYDRFTAKLLAGVCAFDTTETWRDSGATCMSAWLKVHANRTQREATNHARTARRLHQLPVTAAAYEDGRLSSAQVQAIVVNLNDEIAPLFADAEAELIPTLAHMPVGDAAATLQTWAQAAKDSLQDPTDPQPEPPERRLHLSKTLGGRRELSGSLDPEAGALAETALGLAERDDLEGEPSREPSRRRADALVDILRFFLDHQTNYPGRRHRPHLNVFLDYEDLDPTPTTPAGQNPWTPSPGTSGNGAAGEPRATGWPGFPRHDSPGEPRATGWLGFPADPSGPTGTFRPVRPNPSGRLADGTVLDRATIRRLACDAGIHRVVHSGRSSILDYGHTTRIVPTNLFNALIARDQHCRLPGCDQAPNHCEAHHVIPWQQHGPTSIWNIILACYSHHDLIHRQGWLLQLDPNGTLTITTPDGHTHTTHPPGQPPNLFNPRPPPQASQ